MNKSTKQPTELSPVVMLQFWSSGVYGVTLLLPLLPSLLELIVIVSVMVLSMGQIEVCANHLYQEQLLEAVIVY